MDAIHAQHILVLIKKKNSSIGHLCLSDQRIEVNAVIKNNTNVKLKTPIIYSYLHTSICNSVDTNYGVRTVNQPTRLQLFDPL